MSLKKQSKVNKDFSMSSMTDIIFLLLIFFVLTSSVVREPVLRVLLPKANPDRKVTHKSIKVSVSEDGQYAVDTKILSFEDLPSAIISALSSNPEAVVSVYGDKRVQYEKVMEVVKLADDLGAKVVLALEKSPKK
jgi:biopolymer transport protein ExbD